METQKESETSHIALASPNTDGVFENVSDGNHNSRSGSGKQHDQRRNSTDNNWFQVDSNGNAPDAQQKQRGLSVGPQTRSSSVPWRCGRGSVTPGCPSVAFTDGTSNLRFRNIISSARFSAMRGSCTSSAPRQSTALTEGERAALAQMLFTEERRQAALQRVVEEEKRRGDMLIAQEIKKETATLNRIVDLERQKTRRLLEGKERQICRMLQAKQRREAMERERQQKLDALRLKREQQIVSRDPYAMRTVIQRYTKSNSRTGTA